MANFETCGGVRAPDPRERTGNAFFHFMGDAELQASISEKFFKKTGTPLLRLWGVLERLPGKHGGRFRKFFHRFRGGHFFRFLPPKGAGTGSRDVSRTPPATRVAARAEKQRERRPLPASGRGPVFSGGKGDIKNIGAIWQLWYTEARISGVKFGIFPPDGWGFC